MSNLLFDFIDLTKNKQAITIFSIFEITLLLFLDYIFLLSFGIDIKKDLFNSWDSVLINLFTKNFFLAIFGLFIIYLSYKFIIPLLFPIFLIKIVRLIVLLIFFIVSSLEMIVRILIALVLRDKFTLSKANYSTRSILIILNVVNVNSTNKLVKGRNFKYLEEAIDLNEENSIYETFISLSTFFIALSVVFSFYYLYPFLWISLFLLLFTLFCVYLCHLLSVDSSILRIVEEVNPDKIDLSNFPLIYTEKEKTNISYEDGVDPPLFCD